MITKDSELWLAALALVPDKWKPGRCKTTDVTCRHFDQPWFDPESEESKRWVKEGGQHPPFADHGIPAPDITPDLLYAIREAIAVRGYRWELYGSRQKNPKHNYTFFIEDKPGKQWLTEGATEADAIIRAAASLQDVK